MATTTRKTSIERRKAFGAAVAQALSVRGYSQRKFAEELGKTQAAISDWVNAETEPSSDDVFASEKILKLAPGTLSKLLGYLPVGVVKTPASFEAAVMDDQLLDEPAKRGLLAIYRELTDRPASRRGGGNNRKR